MAAAGDARRLRPHDAVLRRAKAAGPALFRAAAEGAGESAPQAFRLFARAGRSEEHTSELQSRLHLVCRLLLEKKNDAAAGERASHTSGLDARRGCRES